MEEFGVIEAVHEVRIAAPRERVWEAITREADAWWRRDFLVGAKATFVIEARPGGRVFEDWGEGHGFLWYTVTAARRPDLLTCAGELFVDWGGPARLQCTWTLSDDGEGGTRVRLAETAFGRTSAKLRASLEQGWRALLTDRLKPFVEDGAVPDVPPPGT